MSAVGVPPRWVVDKLHKAGIPVMNMVGAPKHVKKALAAGVDLICAQVKLPAQFFWFSTLFADTNSRVVKEGAIQEMLQLQF